MPAGKYIRTSEIKEKIRSSLLGTTPWNKGKKRPPFSKKWKENMSKSGKGKKFTEEHKKKISDALKGDKSYAWKGDKVKYVTVHNWVIKWKGQPNICENCEKKVLDNRRIHWANVDHKYQRKLEDYVRLCVECHCEYDKKSK